MMTQKVLDVGQCDIDNWQITQLLTGKFDVRVERARSHAEALQALGDQSFDLVLVNRINDADRSEGMQLVKQIKSDPAHAGTQVMLVSNYADAQRSAVKSGALPGFGKSELGLPQTLDRLATALQTEPR